MKRWRVTPQADIPQGPSVSHESHIHEGDEDSLSIFLSDLQGRTGTPYEAEEYTGEDEGPSDAERREAAKRADAVHDAQVEADEKGRPVETRRGRSRSE